MGLAVLPARLKGEMAELRDAILTGKDLHSTETLASHADWALKFMSKYDKIDESNIDDIINEEIGLVFKEVLECAGVYKCTDEGRAAFQKIYRCGKCIRFSNYLFIMRKALANHTIV